MLNKYIALGAVDSNTYSGGWNVTQCVLHRMSGLKGTVQNRYKLDGYKKECNCIRRTTVKAGAEEEFRVLICCWVIYR